MNATARDASASALLVLAAVAADLVVWNGDTDLAWGGQAPTWLVPVLVVSAASLLLLRRRRPWLVFGAQWLLALTTLVIPRAQPVAGLLIALFLLAARVGESRAPYPLLLAAIPLGVQAYVVADTTSSSTGRGVLLVFLQTFLVWAVVAVGVWGVGRLSYRSAGRAARIRELQLVQAGEELRAERLRIARELHDSVAGAVTGILLQAAGARAVTGRLEQDPVRGAGQVDRSLAAIEEAADRALVELQRLLGVLRSVGVDAESGEADGTGVAPPARVPSLPGPGPGPGAGPGPRPGLGPGPRSAPGAGRPPGIQDIPQLVAASRDAGLDVRLTEEGPLDALHPLGPMVELTAYRVVQEGLTNMHKHAPSGHGEVHLARHDSTLEITVRNEGRSGAPGAGRNPRPSTGLGLLGLRERVELVGGTLTTTSERGLFEVRAVLPAVTPAASARRPAPHPAGSASGDR